MIIFVGRSNVGKSTLIYRLTGKEVKRGKRPGVTRKPVEVNWRGKKVVDMPGFGFMSGVPRRAQERVKDEIVRFIEENSDEIELAILVLDGKAAPEIIERWENRNEIPIDVEFYGFLRELGIPTIVAVNKMDKIKNLRRVLVFLAEKLGIPPSDASSILIPVSAKFETNLEKLKSRINEELNSSKNLKDNVGDGLLNPVQ